MNAPPLVVLASSSRYRAALLARLGVPFEAVAPDVDESPLPGERGDVLSRRLGAAKAAAVRARRGDALVIASDQVVERAGLLLGKPGHHARAHAQLMASSGHTVTVWTSLVVASPSGATYESNVPTRIRFRHLDDATIDAYLRHDTPYDCAGSFKIESGGAALFESVSSDDPNALIGLPLLRLASILRAEGVTLFRT